MNKIKLRINADPTKLIEKEFLKRLEVDILEGMDLHDHDRGEFEFVFRRWDAFRERFLYGETLEFVAKKQGFTRERIRQKEAKAISFRRGAALGIIHWSKYLHNIDLTPI